MLLLVFRHGRIYFRGEFIVPKLLHIFFRWLAQRAVVLMIYGFPEIGQLREVGVFGWVTTRKTSKEGDLGAALQCGSRIETAREPATQSLLLSVPVMVPMTCLHFILWSFGRVGD